MAEPKIDAVLKLLNDAAPIAACGLLDLARNIAAAQALSREVRITVVFRANGQIAMEHPQVIEPAAEQAEPQPAAEAAAEPQPQQETGPQPATEDGAAQEQAPAAEEAAGDQA